VEVPDPIAEVEVLDPIAEVEVLDPIAEVEVLDCKKEFGWSIGYTLVAAFASPFPAAQLVFLVPLDK